MRPITLILTLATTLLAGCVDTTVETSDGGIQTTATRGPVEIVVKADKRTLEVGRTVTLLVEAIVEDDVIMRTPMINANASIGSFNVLQNDAALRSSSPRSRIRQDLDTTPGARQLQGG